MLLSLMMIGIFGIFNWYLEIETLLHDHFTENLAACNVINNFIKPRLLKFCLFSFCERCMLRQASCIFKIGCRVCLIRSVYTVCSEGVRNTMNYSVSMRSPHSHKILSYIILYLLTVMFDID